MIRWCELNIVILTVFYLYVSSASELGAYDVTTILRPPQDDHEGSLEVHTRTNALDMPTNFSEHRDAAAPFYPLNFNCDIKNRTDYGCPGWQFQNWRMSGFDYYDPLLAGSSEMKRLCYSIDADTNAYNYRYEWPENTTRAYLSFKPRDVVTDDFYVGFCDQVGLLSDQRRHCSGLRITFAPYESFFYQNQSFWLLRRFDDFEEYDNSEAKFNVMTDSKPLLAPGFTWGGNNETYTIILENDNNRGCIWVPNAPKQCFLQSDGIVMVSTNITEGMQLRTSPPVLALDSAKGVVSSPFFYGRNLSTVCVSLRYFLDENFSARITFSAVHSSRILAAESQFMVVGGNSTMTKRFTLGLPHTLEQTPWLLQFEVESLANFFIRSITGCLPSDGNVYYVPLQPQDEDILRNISNYDDPNFDVETLPLSLRWKIPEFGFNVNHEVTIPVVATSKSFGNTSASSIFLLCSVDFGYVSVNVRLYRVDRRVYRRLFMWARSGLRRTYLHDLVTALLYVYAAAGCERPLKIFNIEGCYNGGVPYLGGCKCLPGFRGPYCESACPPDRFGADCRGHCSVVDHSGCKGKQLAAPGEKFECARGFTGPSCNTDCGSGFYGPNCRLRCGKCKSGSCDRFSGYCNSPCLQGYRLALCQDRYDFNDDGPVITQVGYDFVEGFIKFMRNRNLFSAYPYYKIQYRKADETSWKSVLVEKQNTSNFTERFRLSELSPATNYEFRVVLVHNSGESYEGDELPITQILTLCNHCDIVDMVVLPHEKHIKVSWKIVEKQFNCPRDRLELEIHMAPLAKPLLYKIPPDASAYTITSILPRSHGAVRIRSVTKLGDIKYYPFVDFYRPALEHIANLTVAEQSSRAIVLQWSTEENLDEAKFHIEYQCRPLICANTHCPSGRLDVTGNRASIPNLVPFSQYIFSVDNHTVAAMTTADLPSEAPVSHPTPVFSEQSTTAWIQWLDPRCEGVHGIQKGFRIELRQRSAVVNVTEDYTSHSFGYSNLKPSTSYEAHVFVVNNKGWNPSKSLRILFTTTQGRL